MIDTQALSRVQVIVGGRERTLLLTRNVTMQFLAATGYQDWEQDFNRWVADDAALEHLLALGITAAGEPTTVEQVRDQLVQAEVALAKIALVNWQAALGEVVRGKMSEAVRAALQKALDKTPTPQMETVSVEQL